ncbi:hypothetical protein DCAR_0416189 [Daucus carota subsp. sativus]|uniref:Uncharacterized protein n=1 Tax=Daucus carota subsp. sativus TaxID=79200 RepID=A0AAF0WXM9_DAUCS|nr:hypothetical protein DCAR_0416189 [Daucus carota subsp. sativus]
MRIDSGQTCSTKDIQIYQWASGYTGVHVPMYTVQILNEGTKDVFGVRISCGDFASTNLINRLIFRRKDKGVCILKNGGQIKQGEMISFRYSNILPYTLKVLQVEC